VPPLHSQIPIDKQSQKHFIFPAKQSLIIKRNTCVIVSFEHALQSLRSQCLYFLAPYTGTTVTELVFITSFLLSLRRQKFSLQAGGTQE
jgi:hypothetical protein